MIWAISHRFHLNRNPREMKLSEIKWWYEGHKRLIAEERAINGSTDANKHQVFSD